MSDHPPYVGAWLCRKCGRWFPSNDPVDPRMYEDFYCTCEETEDDDCNWS